MRRIAIVVGGCAAAVLVAACSGAPSPPPQQPTDSMPRTSVSQPASTTSPSTTSAAPSSVPATEITASGPPFPDGTGRQSSGPIGEADLVLTGVRVGSHEGFDRLVLEFSGTGKPGWTINYVTTPRQDGSGSVVPLRGTAFLDVYATGNTYPETEADYYAGPRHFQPTAGGRIVDVYVAGTFEGAAQVLVGIEGVKRPFRAFALTQPSRLVVDVSRA